MCIAILKPNDKTLDKELLETCSINNPDGCGFAYVDDNGDIIINTREPGVTLENRVFVKALVEIAKN